MLWLPVRFTIGWTVILSPEKIPQHADDTDVLVDKIIGMVKGYSPNANTDMIYVAYKLAKSAHSHQFRRSGAPYIEPNKMLSYPVCPFTKFIQIAIQEKG